MESNKYDNLLEDGIILLEAIRILMHVSSIFSFFKSIRKYESLISSHIFSINDTIWTVACAYVKREGGRAPHVDRGEERGIHILPISLSSHPPTKLANNFNVTLIYLATLKREPSSKISNIVLPLIVGKPVGLFTGFKLGDIVGLSLGKLVGRSVGFKLGDNEGESLGIFVNLVGDDEGITLGEEVGFKVGESIGERVSSIAKGDRVG